MRLRTVLILGVLAILAVAGGWYFGTGTKPAEQTVAAGMLMFPDLASRLNDAARVEITHQGKQTVIEKRPGGAWGIASMHDYPVQAMKLRGVLTGLTELRLAEPRTSDPAQFSRLGVDDPNGATSSADLLQVMATDGKPILSMIVGHRRVRSQPNAPDEIYVRRPDQAQSWLAKGSLQIDADPELWVDRDIMNIGHDRIAAVTIGNDALKFARTDGKFSLVQPADHAKLEDYKVDDVARALETLTLQSVKSDADMLGPETGHAVFTSDDGLALTIRLFHADKDGGDKDVWARFTAAATTDKAKPEADALNARLAGWTYQIGAWKEKSLVPTIDDLKAEPPPPPAAASPAAAPK